MALELCFRGPRLLEDFHFEWCEERGGSRDRWLAILDSAQAYVAILPDDMLTMQELFLARQRMSLNAQCMTCQGRETQPVSSTRTAPTDRKPLTRAVQFFFSAFQRMLDATGNGPDSPCPILDELWASQRKFLDNMPPFLSRPIDFIQLVEREAAKAIVMPRGRG